MKKLFFMPFFFICPFLFGYESSLFNIPFGISQEDAFQIMTEKGFSLSDVSSENTFYFEKEPEPDQFGTMVYHTSIALNSEGKCYQISSNFLAPKSFILGLLFLFINEYEAKPRNIVCKDTENSMLKLTLFTPQNEVLISLEEIDDTFYHCVLIELSSKYFEK